MWCAVEEKRVNLWLRKRIFHKSVTFSLVAFSFCFFVNRASAVVLSKHAETATKTLTVSVTVPLTQEFIYVLKKNSSVTVKKSALVVGEMVQVEASLVGGNRQVLPNHQLVLSVRNSLGKEAIVIVGGSDIRGKAIFSFEVGDSLLGKSVVWVEDTTYGAPLRLDSKLLIIVYETEKEAENSQKIMKKSTATLTVLMPIFTKEKLNQEEKNFQKSGTIKIHNESRALPRAGPEPI